MKPASLIGGQPGIMSASTRPACIVIQFETLPGSSGLAAKRLTPEMHSSPLSFPQRSVIIDSRVMNMKVLNLELCGALGVFPSTCSAHTGQLVPLQGHS